MASIKGCIQPRPSHLFTWLRKEKREKKGRKENQRKTKEKPREKKKKRKREKKGGGNHGSKGRRRRRSTAARKKREKSPRATTNHREPPSPPPTSVTPGKLPKPVFRKVFIFKLQNSFENWFLTSLKPYFEVQKFGFKGLRNRFWWCSF